MTNRIIKSAVFLIIIFLTGNVSFAQKENNIKKHSSIVNEAIKANNFDMASVTKMSDLANDINCHLTKKQAEACGLVNFSDMRNRSCGSPDFPTKEEYTANDIVIYKATINKLKKYYMQKH